VPTSPVARRAAFVSAVIGPVIGALFLFAPLQGYCSSTISATPAPPGATPGPPATAGPQSCGMQALWQSQQIFPMPFIAVLVWSLAPALVYLGVVLRLRGDRTSGAVAVVAGILLEATVLISFGAAPFFVPFVLLPLMITTAIALMRS
jgi:hypothetical protein